MPSVFTSSSYRCSAMEAFVIVLLSPAEQEKKKKPDNKLNQLDK